MRIWIVSLLAALLLTATAAMAVAQEPDAPATDSVAPTTEDDAGGNTDWIRTVGIIGIAGVWGVRGVNSVRRSRLERAAWADESAKEPVDGPSPADGGSGPTH